MFNVNYYVFQFFLVFFFFHLFEFELSGAEKLTSVHSTFIEGANYGTLNVLKRQNFFMHYDKVLIFGIKFLISNFVTQKIILYEIRSRTIFDIFGLV